MGIERKDMLLAADSPERPKPAQSETKLAETLDEGASYLQLIDTRGWKLLVKNYIEPRSSLNRILAQPGGRQRDEAIAAVAELEELKKYINGRIADGKKANDELETIRKQRRNK